MVKHVMVGLGMMKLVRVWLAALLVVAVMAATGSATGNETLMLVTFFTCKLLWFLYLALLLEWLARRRDTESWLRTRTPQLRRPARRMPSP